MSSSERDNSNSDSESDKKKQNLKKELQDYKAKYQKYKSKYLALKNSQNKTQMKTTPYKTYDIVIEIDSLLSSNEGWNIKYLNKKKVDEYSQEKQVAIGVIGRENTGKTYLINKISEENFPSDYYESTKGLSLKYISEKKKQLKVFLDTQGMNAGISFNDKEMVEKYRRFLGLKTIKKDSGKEKGDSDKKKTLFPKKDLEKVKELMINDRAMTEEFLQRFILDSCDIIIIMIEMLTHFDQKIIERIKSRYSALKTIIIVHNLFKLEDKNIALKRAEYDIKSSFPLVSGENFIPNTQVPIYIEEKANKNTKNILHVILGREKNPSGNFFNQATLAYIKQNMEVNVDLKPFNILDKINDFWKFSHSLYFNPIKEKLPLFEIKKNEAKEYLMILKNPVALVLRPPEFTALGSLKSVDVNYSCYVGKDAKRTKIYYFEVPGCSAEPKIKIVNKYQENSQYITMEIPIDVKIPENFECIDREICSQNYTKRILISDQHGFYAIERFTYQNGILEVRLSLKEEEEEVKDSKE